MTTRNRHRTAIRREGLGVRVPKVLGDKGLEAPETGLEPVTRWTAYRGAGGNMALNRGRGNENRHQKEVEMRKGSPETVIQPPSGFQG